MRLDTKRLLAHLFVSLGAVSGGKTHFGPCAHTRKNERRPVNRPSFERYKSTRRFANLDGLRFVSILLVLWHHAIPEGSTLNYFLERGFLGVDIFFVLSGY